MSTAPNAPNPATALKTQKPPISARIEQRARELRLIIALSWGCEAVEARWAVRGLGRLAKLRDKRKDREDRGMIDKISIVDGARRLARAAHRGQMYGDRPYFGHLVDVVGVLSEFGVEREELHATAYLHDTLEDTPLSRDQIAEFCGAWVAGLVAAVTDEPGANRKERKAKTYPKIAANPDAILIKLADRIANVRESQKNSPGLLAMYRKEYPEFRRALFDSQERISPEAWFMWLWLDRALMERRDA